MDTSAVDETKPIENKPPVINPPLEPSPVELPPVPPSATAPGRDADIRIHLPGAGPTGMPPALAIGLLGARAGATARPVRKAPTVSSPTAATNANT